MTGHPSGDTILWDVVHDPVRTSFTYRCAIWRENPHCRPTSLIEEPSSISAPIIDSREL